MSRTHINPCQRSSDPKSEEHLYAVIEAMAKILPEAGAPRVSADRLNDEDRAALIAIAKEAPPPVHPS